MSSKGLMVMEGNKTQLQWYFDADGDFKTQFEKTVNQLIEKNIIDREARMMLIDRLVNTYVNQVPRDVKRPENERPDMMQLERLANYIMKEELTDKRKNKVKLEEYPVFTEFQLAARRSFEVPTSRLIDRRGESTVGTDGTNYRIPHRRTLTVQDQINMDYRDYRKQVIARSKGQEAEFIKAANTERKRREREARKPGPVISYNLKDLPPDHELVIKYG
jgi:ribosomal protein L14E/L6E/L27E